MNDIQIKSFMCAAELQNFTKAAEKLYISQPVLGRHISNLESELGFKLFDRERKTVKLTENGKIFLEFLKASKIEYEKTMAQIKSNLRSTTMSLIIGTGEGQQIGQEYAPAFQYIVANKPEIRTKIAFLTNNKIIDALKDGIIDAAILNYDDIVDYLDVFDCIKTKAVKNYFVMTSSNPLAMKKNLTPRDFKDECFIILSKNDSELAYKMHLETLKKIGATKFIEAPDISTLSELVEAGIGITSIPENNKLCSNSNIVCVSFPQEQMYHTEAVVWRKQDTNPAIRLFVEILKKNNFYIPNDK